MNERTGSMGSAGRADEAGRDGASEREIDGGSRNNTGGGPAEADGRVVPRMGLLLLSLVLLPLAGPLIGAFAPVLAGAAVSGAYALVLVGAGVAAARSRTGLITVGLTMLPLIATVATGAVRADVNDLAVSASAVPLMIASGMMVLRYTLIATILPTARVLGSACVFLLMSHAFSGVYSAIELARPGSFVDAAAADNPMVGEEVRTATLLYLSLVTQTTVGFGDVHPVSSLARSIASLQSAAGIFYMAVVVSQFVGRLGWGERAT
jgi:hypothetical protein